VISAFYNKPSQVLGRVKKSNVSREDGVEFEVLVPIQIFRAIRSARIASALGLGYRSIFPLFSEDNLANLESAGGYESGMHISVKGDIVHDSPTNSRRDYGKLRDAVNVLGGQYLEQKFQAERMSGF